MCGIVGYIGKQNASNILIEGLKRLEYRGYDSAGLSVMAPDRDIFTLRATGRVAEVEKKCSTNPLLGSVGISHTRWATHGKVTEENAHPHMSCDGLISVVHNGVIENYNSIKLFLISQNFTFESETDTEVLANLIAYHYKKDSSPDRFMAALRKSLAQVKGTYGVAVICKDEPNRMLGARSGSPLIIGVGNNENMIASDVAALAGRTSNVIFLNDGEIADLTSNNFTLSTLEAEQIDPQIDTIDWEIEDAEMGEFSHFMEKEIFEQPEAIKNAMRGRFSDDMSTAKFGGLNMSPRELRQIDRILLCGCGTTWHAGLVAKQIIERYARIPCEVEYASEFRYRNAPLDKNTLVIVISQSGETIDTLASLREANRKGYRVLVVTNVVGSTIARETDGGIYQHAGPEIGVASTKAFTSQLTIFSMLALFLGRLRDMSFSDGQRFVRALEELPNQVEEVLKQKDKIKEIAKRFAPYEDFLFLGRQLMYPIALEGALKLKEISYIHAEGYPSGEMKHGPIALISESCPSVFLASGGETFSKSLANIEEVRSRKGEVLVITPKAHQLPENLLENSISIPDAHDAVIPILASIPVQLLSYYIAVERNCDVDKPRNLAKSVTVE